jgi:TolB protein
MPMAASGGSGGGRRAGGDRYRANVKNNNDHGISPDGTQLIISDQSEPDNLSRIWRAAAGGIGLRARGERSEGAILLAWLDARREDLAYVRVGTKDDSYDIWSQDLAGGPARPLITGPGLDDGPEYSPDGKWLYFNSTRSGAMQIWRARPDGSDPSR